MVKLPKDEMDFMGQHGSQGQQLDGGDSKKVDGSILNQSSNNKSPHKSLAIKGPPKVI